jgi:hypothetical protein
VRAPPPLLIPRLARESQREDSVVSTYWEQILELAREVEAENQAGTLDPKRAARLAGAVLELQRELVIPRPYVARAVLPDHKAR